MEKLPLDRVRWPLVALLASAAMLAAAFGIFETLMHLAPCQMCWWQRYAHFAACGVALVAIVLNWRGAGPRTMTAFSILLGFTFGVSFFLGGWHALFEWNLAPGPDTCVAASGSEAITGNLSDILSRPIGIVSCKEAMWRLPNAPWGLSMAGYNAIISGVLMALSFYAATQPPMRDTANEPVQP
jgi:disulfide bond formation protein DsbB